VLPDTAAATLERVVELVHRETAADGLPTGILLLTFGSAVTADQVPAYLRSVRGGSDATPS